MRSIKFCLIRRQRPRQFSYDCWGFDFSGVEFHLSHAGVCLLNDRMEPGPHFAPSLLPEKPKRAQILSEQIATARTEPSRVAAQGASARLGSFRDLRFCRKEKRHGSWQFM